MSLALDHGEVAYAAQQGVGYTRRAARAQRHLHGGLVVDRDVEYACRALDYARQYGGVVILQMALYAEARTQGRCEQAAAGGGADKGEGCQLDLYRAGRRPLVEDNVDLVVLHGRV